MSGLVDGRAADGLEGVRYHETAAVDLPATIGAGTRIWRRLRKEWQVQAGNAPVIGITGTGGAGKSSVTDEILNRFLGSFPDFRIAVLAVDPTRRRTGGALVACNC